MGSSQSSHTLNDDDDDDDDDEGDNEQHRQGEEEDEDEDEERLNGNRESTASSKKVLQQAPEILPCHASASPLSPQLSSLGTPRLGLGLGSGPGPSIKVWDPYNLLSPRPFPLLDSPLLYVDEDPVVAELFFITHGESDLSLRPDLVPGRWPSASLTSIGKRQARALAVFLKSQGVRFSSVYSSPLARSTATTVSVCQELNFAEDQIQSSDALLEMSQGQWEGCHRSEIYTPEMISFIERLQPDFCPPSGESLRQVEFRMVEFVNHTVLRLPEKLRSGYLSLHQSDSKAFSRHNSLLDRDGSSLPQWDLLHRHHRQGLSRKNSGKSRLQIVTTGDNKNEDEFSPNDVNSQSSVSSVGIFTHVTPIKCLIMGLLGCSPVKSHQICIDDSSITVLQYSLRTGWQIKRLNDTAHLRLL